MRYLMCLVVFGAGLVWDCAGSVCQKPRLPLRGISLLQALSKNKSSNSSLTSPNASVVDDAMNIAETVGNVTEDSLSSSVNETGAAAPIQNLSAPTVGVNYSDIAADEKEETPPQPPYSTKNDSKVVKVHPIDGASPLPEPQPPNITSEMRDCIMSDWSSWSECLTDTANGYAGSHQVRDRSIVQPYLPGGRLCEPTLESRNCLLISAANTLVNLGE